MWRFIMSVAPRDGCRVLIVEDEKSLRNLVTLHLKKQGYEVVGAANSREAKNIYLADQKFDVIILDLRGLDESSEAGLANGLNFQTSGERLLADFKDAGCEIPVIVTTGTLDQDVVRSILGLGALLYIAKPYSIIALEKLVGMVFALDEEVVRQFKKMFSDYNPGNLIYAGQEVRDNGASDADIVVSEKIGDQEEITAEKLLVTVGRFNRQIEVAPIVLRTANKLAICLSVSAGCALRCAFCATGQLLTGGNLTSDEIIEQMYYALSFYSVIATNMFWLSDPPMELEMSFMGQGEPTLNLDNVLRAIVDMQNRYWRGKISAVISTIGLVPGLKNLLQSIAIKLGVRLQISLHFIYDEQRNKYMPVTASSPIDTVMQLAVEYAKQSGQRVWINYLLFGGEIDRDSTSLMVALSGAGVGSSLGKSISRPRPRQIDDINEVGFYDGIKNDTPQHAIGLANLIRKYRVEHFHIRISEFNPIDPFPDGSNLDQTRIKKSSTFASAWFIRTFLEQPGIEKENVTIFRSLGQPINTACGTLAGGFRNDR
jgi:DNA-binding response OmpR family regulator/pyruvate-formate lyase-activating enzyme